MSRSTRSVTKGLDNFSFLNNSCFLPYIWWIILLIISTFCRSALRNPKYNQLPRIVLIIFCQLLLRSCLDRIIPSTNLIFQYDSYISMYDYGMKPHLLNLISFTDIFRVLNCLMFCFSFLFLAFVWMTKLWQKFSFYTKE